MACDVWVLRFACLFEFRGCVGSGFRVCIGFGLELAIFSWFGVVARGLEPRGDS